LEDFHVSKNFPPDVLKGSATFASMAAVDLLDWVAPASLILRGA